MYIYNKTERKILKEYIDKLKRKNKELENERAKIRKSIEEQEGLIKEIIKLEDYQEKLEEEIEDLKNSKYYEKFIKDTEKILFPEKFIKINPCDSIYEEYYGDEDKVKN